MNFVIAFGNPFDGLTLFGPFRNKDEAIEYASENDGGEPWDVVELRNIDDVPE